MCLRGRPEGAVGGDGGGVAAFHTQRCIFVLFVLSSNLTTCNYKVLPQTLEHLGIQVLKLFHFIL